MVTWETSSEIQTVGFNLWRSSSGNRIDARQVTSALIIATGDVNSGAVYHYTDMDIQPGVHYTYWLQEVRLDGTTVDMGATQSQFLGTLYLPLIAQ